MSLILGQNYDVAYPVNFYSGGDTTRDAFLKHIQEIERIYGALTALDAGKASSTEITSAINNAINNLDLNNLSGSIDASKISGNIDGSKIYGFMPNASIYANQVIMYGYSEGSQRDVQNIITSMLVRISSLESGSGGDSGGSSGTTDKGDGITESQLNANGGYVKFNNGLLIQWGINISTTINSSNGVLTGNLVKNFSSACYLSFVQPSNRGHFYDSGHTGASTSSDYTFSGSCSTTTVGGIYTTYNSEGKSSHSKTSLDYFAIGI